jgi:hypothetical protein
VLLGSRFWLAEEMKELVEFQCSCRVLQLGARLQGTILCVDCRQSPAMTVVTGVTAECWRLTMSWPGRGCDRGRRFGWVLIWRGEDVDDVCSAVPCE